MTRRSELRSASAPIASRLPFACALVFADIMLSLPDRDRSDRSSTTSPGGMNARIFISGTNVAFSVAPAGQCGAPAAACSDTWISRVEEQGARKHWAPREVVREKLRLARHAQQRTHAFARDEIDGLDVVAGDAAELPAGRARAAQQFEALTYRVGAVEVLGRKHRAYAVPDLDHQRAVHVRPAR